MPEQPLLSVLLPTGEQPDPFLSMLQLLLEFRLPEVELVIIHDGVEDALDREIRQLLDHHPDDRHFYLEHPQSHGRGRSLNEALGYASGQFVWSPLRADRLNRGLLREALRKMKLEPAAFWILDRSMPSGLEEILSEIEHASLPEDSRLIFDRSVIPPARFHFNEHLKRFHAFDLALRLSDRHPWHTTDAFFVVDRTPAPLPDPETVQELLLTLLREARDERIRTRLLEHLSTIDFSLKTSDPLSELEKIRILAEEDARLALGLIDNFLRQHTHHEKGTRLKVKILEKLRRHVEAAELKHELQNRSNLRPVRSRKQGPLQPTLFAAPDGETRQEPFPDAEVQDFQGTDVTEPEREQPAEAEPPVRLSVIIPTTGAGKPILEECLVHLDRACDPSATELIVIDNASIDDTFDYLEQLKKDRFLRIRVITNPQNIGFAASVNQGLEVARGEFALLIHNDVIIDRNSLAEMLTLMETNNFIGVAGPVVDRCDNPDQLPDQEFHREGRDEGFVRTRHLDSCCMLVRLSITRGADGVRFNDAYGSAFYEDADFCRSIAERGYYVVISTRSRITHHHRLTTGVMGLNLEPELRWENQDVYNARWGESPDLTFPGQGDLPERIHAIPLPVNPLNPPGYWLDQMEEFLNDERRTEIHKRDLEIKDLFRLIELLMAADKRDLLRQIETRVEGAPMPVELLKGLIRYYYRHFIYSRCRLYLESPEAVGPWFDLYRLRIAVAEKETGAAVDLLAGLMEQFPCHAELFRIAGDIHEASGNQEEARSFHALADQLGPDRRSQIDAFEIKY